MVVIAAETMFHTSTNISMQMLNLTSVFLDVVYNSRRGLSTIMSSNITFPSSFCGSA